MEDRVAQRLAQAESALGRLREVCDIAAPSMIERDAAILRFAFTAEIMWKAARAVLLEHYGRERPLSGAPKAIVRECRSAGLLSDAQAEAALEALNDRNLAVHVYDEATAAALYGRIAAHASVLSQWLDALRTAASAGP